MDKASRVIRRSGVKLLSMGAAYGDLNMLLSDIKEVKTSAKTFMTTQHQAAQDMAKWAAHEENKAVQDVMCHIAELYLVWTDIQKTFIDQLKEYRQVFEMVLEGEKQVSHAKDNLEYCVEKEMKVRKELKKCAKRASTQELRLLESRVQLAEQAKEHAEIEVSERIRENEAVKLIRLKEGLLRMSGAYCELSHKANVVFTAQREHMSHAEVDLQKYVTAGSDRQTTQQLSLCVSLHKRNVVLQLPDVHGQPLETVQYSGARTTQYIVEKAKEKIQAYSAPNVASDPPPPYTPPTSERSTSLTPSAQPRRPLSQLSTDSDTPPPPVRPRDSHPRSHSTGEIAPPTQDMTPPPPTYSSAVSVLANSTSVLTEARSDSDLTYSQTVTSQTADNTMVQTSSLQVRRGSGTPVIEVTHFNQHTLSSSDASLDHGFPDTSSSERQCSLTDNSVETGDQQQGPGTEQELRPIPTPRKKSDAGEGSAANYWSG